MKIHSKIDVITNSSTEVFILNTKKPLEDVKIILSKITSGYCEPEILVPGCEIIQRLEDYNYLIDPNSKESIERYWINEVFLKDYYLDYTTLNTVIVPGGKEIKEAWYKFVWDRREEINQKRREDYPESKYVPISERTYEEFRFLHSFFSPSEFPDGMIENFVEEYRSSGKPIPEGLDKIPDDMLVTTYLGKIGFIGKEDNSIPYDTWETIERILDSQNWHLG